LAQARSFFDRALTADPDNVDAVVGSAAADARLSGNFFVADPASVFAGAEAKLTKALSSLPGNVHGQMWLGYVEILTKRAAQGIGKCEHALALDRNLANAHAFIGLGKIFVGRAEETEAHVGEAARLSPLDTNAHVWKYVAGIAKLVLGNYDQAAEWLRRAIEANRINPLAFFQLAAALAQLSRLDEARSAVKAGLALNPTFAISRARDERQPDVSGPARAHFRRPAQARSPRAITSARRLAAWPSISSATRGSWARTRRGRRGLRACGQDGRSEDRHGRSSPHLSQAQRQRLSVRKPILQPAFDGLRKAGLLEETRKLAAKKPGRENARKEERVRCS
jgi:tetratricopeptide (TPR) repeat protein